MMLLDYTQKESIMEFEFITWLKYLFLGMLQGFTEPIPVSSSGHLVLAQHFLGIESEGMSFELLVNAGSLTAIFIVYWEDIKRLAANGISYVATKKPEAKQDFAFIMYLVIATIPAGVIGVLFNDQIAESLKGVKIIGVTLLVTGLALYLIRNLRGRKQDGDITIRDSIIVGLAQAVALIPGISRSGATIVASLGLGMKPETALRFSFLLYIPVSLGGTVLSITDIASDPNISDLFIPYLTAFFASAFTTYFAVKWFMGILAKGNLGYFSVYCFIVGAAVLIFG